MLDVVGRQARAHGFEVLSATGYPQPPGTSFDRRSHSTSSGNCRLSWRVLAEPAELKRLEALIHPAVARAREAFLVAHRDSPLVVLDIPLLFEKGGLVGIAAGSVSLLGSIVLTFFEGFVQILQAYVFVLLTALYIGGAMSEEH